MIPIREGIKVGPLHKKRGVYKGRPAKLNMTIVSTLVKRLSAGEKPAELAREFNISRMTLHRYKVKATGEKN